MYSSSPNGDSQCIDPNAVLQRRDFSLYRETKLNCKDVSLGTTILFALLNMLLARAGE